LCRGTAAVLHDEILDPDWELPATDACGMKDGIGYRGQYPLET
jgi:hypothetical protein